MIARKVHTLSRNWMANKHQHIPLHERLKEKQSVDLRDNHVIVDLGNGYDAIVPIDNKKKFK